MTKKTSAKKQPPQPPERGRIRPSARHVEVFNSGLEVWLYDEASADEIRATGLWTRLVGGKKVGGLLVGYSLWQDDELSIDVVVGEPLTGKELSKARWLEPQQAFLRLPSGALVIEANDSCRVSPEAADITDKGAVVKVPPGDYRLTLHRLDHESLDRDGIEWKGAQEVIVLTPGGTKKDDFPGLIPFEESADLGWVGKIEVSGATAKGLVWFDDYWDTYFANIDKAAARTLGLTPGRYFRTTVPAVGITFTTVFAENWEEGAKLNRPAGPKLAEFGFGSIIVPQRWGKEALLAKRVNAATAIPEKQKTTWLEATFEVFDAEPESPKARSTAGALHAGKRRSFHADALAEKEYFPEGTIDLAIKLDQRVKGVSFDESITLAETVGKLDAAMTRLGLTPLGDFSFELDGKEEMREFTVRAWTGLPGIFAAAWAAIDSFEVFFFSRAGRKWVLTGTIDEDDSAGISARRPRIQMQGKDDAPLAALLKVHRSALAGAGITPESVPGSLATLTEWYDDYLDAALD
jgi:hypothetical protein